MKVVEIICSNIWPQWAGTRDYTHIANSLLCQILLSKEGMEDLVNYVSHSTIEWSLTSGLWQYAACELTLHNLK